MSPLADRTALRTCPPEPRANPEQLQADKPQPRRCERCGCKVASDATPYRGHLLCSPCLAPITMVADAIADRHREHIVGLCSGYTGSQVAAALGCGTSTPSGTVLACARSLDISTTTLRDSIQWALERGLIKAVKGLPLERPAESERDRLMREYTDALEGMPPRLGTKVETWLLRTIRLAHDLGREIGREEATTETK